MKFYLGTHSPEWLTRSPVSLFVCHRRLALRASMPKAVTTWALDSGGFTELSTYGKWELAPQTYADAVQGYAEKIGGLEFAAPQDWMCEPHMVQKTGLSVREHQKRTTDNFLLLRELAPTMPFIPVLQGYKVDEYLQHIEDYEAAGVNLRSEPRVGVGSVCRRQSTQEIQFLIETLRAQDLRIHAFGVKTQGLARYGDLISSSDSLAWSEVAKHNPPMPGHTHKACQNCMEFALKWRENILGRERDTQLPFGISPVTDEETLMIYPQGDSRSAYVPGPLAQLTRDAKQRTTTRQRALKPVWATRWADVPQIPDQIVWDVYAEADGMFAGELHEHNGRWRAHLTERAPREYRWYDTAEAAAAVAGWEVSSFGLAQRSAVRSTIEHVEPREVAYVGYPDGSVRFCIYDPNLEIVSTRVFASAADARDAEANGVDVFAPVESGSTRDVAVTVFIECSGGFWFETRASTTGITSDRSASNIAIDGDTPDPAFVTTARNSARDSAHALF